MSETGPGEEKDNPEEQSAAEDSHLNQSEGGADIDDTEAGAGGEEGEGTGEEEGSGGGAEEGGGYIHFTYSHNAFTF